MLPLKRKFQQQQLSFGSKLPKKNFAFQPLEELKQFRGVYHLESLDQVKSLLDINEEDEDGDFHITLTPQFFLCTITVTGESLRVYAKIPFLTGADFVNPPEIKLSFLNKDFKKRFAFLKNPMISHFRFAVPSDSEKLIISSLSENAKIMSDVYLNSIVTTDLPADEDEETRNAICYPLQLSFQDAHLYLYSIIHPFLEHPVEMGIQEPASPLEEHRLFVHINFNGAPVKTYFTVPPTTFFFCARFIKYVAKKICLLLKAFENNPMQFCVAEKKNMVCLRSKLANGTELEGLFMTSEMDVLHPNTLEFQEEEEQDKKKIQEEEDEAHVQDAHAQDKDPKTEG